MENLAPILSANQRQWLKWGLPYTVLIVILLFAYSLRSNTFYLSHLNGDQHTYLALAMKLEQFGLNGYNLRGINIVSLVDPKWGRWGVGLVPAEPGDEGHLIKRGYTNEPLYHIAPGFPYLLRLSHAIFNEGQPYLTVSLNLGERVNLERPELFRDAQFYAVIIPLASSLLLIILTFVLGKYLFSDTVGLMAALMIAMNPIDIMTAQRVWADDSLGVFLVVGVLSYFASRRYDAGWMAFLGGVSCGYAVLLKQTGGFILPALIAYHVWLHRKYLLTLGGFRQILYEKFLFIFLVGLFITSAPWFFTVYQTYGNPIYTPYTLNLETATTDWVKTLLSRPPPIILYGVGIPYLMPLFVFFYPAVVRLGLKREDLYDERVFLVLWVISFLGMFMIFDGREHRYMLPAYPAIAVLSASFIDWARGYLNERFTPYLGNGSCAAMFVLTAIWSVPIGMSAVLNNYGLILIPF